MLMNRKKTRLMASIVAGFMAFIMLFSLVSSLFGVGAVNQKDIDALKDKLESTAAERKKLERELDSLDGQKTDIVKEISVLDRQISAKEEEINLHTDIIADMGAMIEQKQGEIEVAQVKEDEQYARLKARVRVMYESGDTSYLGVLLESDDFFDFLSRFEIVSQISTYEKKVVEELKATKEQIITQKQEIETAKAEEIVLKDSLAAKKSDLDAQMTKRNSDMKNIEDIKEGELEKYEQITAEEERMNAEIKKKIAELAAQNKGDYVGGTFTWPAPGYTRITSQFGMRLHPVLHVYKLHTGVDVGAPAGASIVAANGGTVITATYNSALGNYTVIDHGGGVATLYAHQSKQLVSKGDKVSKGQQIGKVGNTGYSTGPHLHFEIIKGGKNIDPMSEYK